MAGHGSRDVVDLVGLDICVIQRTSSNGEDNEIDDNFKVTSVLETEKGLLTGTFESMEEEVVLASGERTPPRSLTNPKNHHAISTPETVDATYVTNEKEQNDDETLSNVSDLTGVEDSPFMDFIKSVDNVISKMMEDGEDEMSSPDLVHLRKHSQSSNDDSPMPQPKRCNSPKEKKLDDVDFIVPVADFTKKVDTQNYYVQEPAKPITGTKRSTRREQYRQTLRKRRNRQRAVWALFFAVIAYYRQPVVTFVRLFAVVSLHCWKLELSSDENTIKDKKDWFEIMNENNIEEEYESEKKQKEEDQIAMVKPIYIPEDRGCHQAVNSAFDFEDFLDSMMHWN